MDETLHQNGQISPTGAVHAMVAGRGLRYHIVTFGCQQNEADSEKLAGMCRAMGYLPTDKPQEASLIVLNTCAIRRHAEEKAFSVLGTCYAARRDRGEDTVFALVGCMAAEPSVVERIRRVYRYVAFTLEPSGLARFPELLLNRLCEGGRRFVIGEDDGKVTEGLPVERRDRIRPYVPIMYGCNNFCSYCIVPYVRGRERSRPSSAVLEEVRTLAAEGAKEITLLGQNVNSYRADKTFPELLRAAADVPGDFLLRFMTSHPKDVSPELIRVIHDKRGKVAAAFHLPLQSGSNRILRSMNRTYTREKYLDTVRLLREAVPEISLTTDIIVGFPGETEEDFLDTLDIVRTVGYSNIYSFIYSPREGTVAAKMTNIVPHEVSVDRMTRLLECQRQVSEENNRQAVGKIYRVLTDGYEDGVARGKTEGGIPVRFPADTDPTDTFAEVKITASTPHALSGVPVYKNH